MMAGLSLTMGRVGGPQSDFAVTTGYCAHCSPAVAGNGTVFIGSEDGKLYGLNPGGTLSVARKGRGEGARTILAKA